ncbi:MAG: electron transport complex subunit RsxE [Brevinemataceae bacterium]
MKKNDNLLSWTVFEKGILRENPVFVLMIGLCSSLAVSINLSNAFAMGGAVIFVLACSNVMVSLLRNMIPQEIRVPVFVVIIAGFTTIVEILMQRFTPLLYDVLGIYLPLVIVNCIILGRAENFASKHNMKNSLFDGLGMGIGYLLALVAISFVRELFGAGTLSFKIAENIGIILNFSKPVLQDLDNPLQDVVNLFGPATPVHTKVASPHLIFVNVFPIIKTPLPIFQQPAGGFFVIGLILAVIQKMVLLKSKKSVSK